MSYLEPSDFVGKYKLSTGTFSVNKLNDYIARYELKYSRELLGVTLYNEFLTDLDVNNVPQSPNFLKIYDAFALDTEFIGNARILQSEGFKEMLKGFIYFEYSKDLINEQTPYGNVKPQAENSTVSGTLYNTMYNRYNEAVVSYRAIQERIVTKLQNEPTGQLVTITMTQPGTNVIAGTYPVVGGTGTGATFIVTTTPGLEVDSVTIGDPGEGYTVGDQLSIEAGNNDLIVNTDYVGKGDLKKFNGIRKHFTTWL